MLMQRGRSYDYDNPSGTCYLLSDKAGSWVGKILAEKGLLGYGSAAARHLAVKRKQKSYERARDEHIAWMDDALKQKKESDEHAGME